MFRAHKRNAVELGTGRAARTGRLIESAQLNKVVPRGREIRGIAVPLEPPFRRRVVSPLSIASKLDSLSGSLPRSLRLVVEVCRG